MPILRMVVDENRLRSSAVLGVEAYNKLTKLLLHQW
jgi:hypothetical protein